MTRWLAVFSVLIISRVYAQELPIVRYTLRDGLPHEIVYRLMQDPDGYLWVSTDNGLGRFDGTHFRNYHKSSGIGSSFIFGSTCYRNKLIVSGYEAGTAVYIPGKGFRKFSELSNVSYPIDYFQTTAGLFVTDRKYHIYHHNRRITGQDGQPTVVSEVLQLRNGTILAVGKAFMRFDKRSGRFVSITRGPDKTAFYNSAVELPDGRMVVAQNTGLFVYSADFKHCRKLLTASFEGSRKCLLFDRNRQLWVADMDGNVWLFTENMREKRLVASNVIVNQMLEDREGNVWLATYGQGLWCVTNVFIQSKPVRGELYKDIALWRKNGAYDAVPVQHLSVKQLPVATIRNLFSMDSDDFFKLDFGVLYYGENEFFTASQNTLYYVTRQRVQSFPLEGVSCIKLIRHAGVYWLGTRTGLYIIDIQKGKIRKENQLSGRIIYDLHGGKENQLLVATNDGFYAGTSQNWKHYRTTGEPGGDVVNTVCYDPLRNEVLAGTNYGVFTLDAKGILKPLTHIGFCRCNDIETDRNQHTWLATSKGLFARNRYRYTLLDKEFGSQTGAGIRKMAYDESGNVLYALFYDRIMDIPLDKVMQETPALPYRIKLDDLLIDNRRVKSGNHRQHELVHLETNKSITLNFSLPVFRNANHSKLFYRLNGEPWQLITGRRTLRLYSIPYDENKLEVMALDVNGRRISTFDMTILHKRPFYLERWFMLAVMLCVLALLVFFARQLIRSRIRKAERNLETQQQLAELRHKSLLNMLNPHFLNNAINSIQAFVVRNDQRNTLRYLSKLAKLMRLNLDLLEASFVTLEKELDNIELYLHFEQIRSGEKLVYAITISPEINPSKQLIPAFILQPYVENAIWHGILPKEGVGTVQISIEKQSDQMLISITDDGIGIAASELRKPNHNKISRGTRIIQERLALLNNKQAGYEVKIVDRTLTGGPGTEVRILIPLMTC